MLETIHLRCEYLINPLGIDTRCPSFTWALRGEGRGRLQSAYQIQAAASPEALLSGADLTWDSGKTPVADGLAPANYAGRALLSRERLYWRVRAWDEQDQAGPFSSDPAWFEMGLLDGEDWEASWIGYPAGWNGRALYFRREFTLEKPIRRGRVYVSGLGYYELRLNGQKVGDHVLDPGVTDPSKRVLYCTYDVGDLLQPGSNAVGAVLGNGWHGMPKLLLMMMIDFTDGTSLRLTTGRNSWKTTWAVSSGPILQNSIYDGEVYDARLERPGWDAPGFDTSSKADRLALWIGANNTDAPGGRLAAQTVEPIRVVERRPFQSLTQPAPGRYVFDLGQNIAGWAHLRVQGQAGDRVVLRFAESLYDDGTVNQENLRAAAATDSYILKGGGEEQWEPHFTYHGFRYVQMEGFPGEPSLDSLTGCVVRSAVEANGEFECSSSLLNRIHHMVRWTETSNLHSIPTDCPQRDERMGWMNDLAARSEEMVYNFKMPRFLAKFLDDIGDAQDPTTGAIPDTVPFRWGMRPADPVSASYLLMPWLAYQHYGDLRSLAEHYDGLKGWVGFLTSQAKEHIVEYSYYGDWAPPVGEGLANSLGDSANSRDTPGPLMSTGYYYLCAQLISKMAQALGPQRSQDDASRYAELARQIGEAFNRRFWDEQTGGYGSNNQACNTFALFLGLAPPERKQRVLDNLVHDVVDLRGGHLTTGNLCTKYLLDVLTEAGRVDVAYQVAAQETYPSWGYMLANGATTCWERWERKTGGGMNSHNHPMYGSVGAWFYKALAGITVDPSGPGFARFNVRPALPAGLSHARAVLHTWRGDIEAGWQRSGKELTMRVVTPAGSRARISVPKPDGGQGSPTIYESGKPVWENGALCMTADGLTGAQEEAGCVTFSVGSGTYTFTVRS